MKALYLILGTLLLTACGPSPEQFTATAMMTQAQTETAAPTFAPTLISMLTLTPTPTLISTPPTPTVRLVQVIVIAESIPMGTMITEEILGLIDLPETSMVSVLFSKDRVNEVVGKLAKYPLEPGVPLTSAVLVNTADELPPCR